MDLSDTLNVFAKLTENFLGAFEKKVSAQKMKLKIRLEYSEKSVFFGLKVFSKASGKYSVNFVQGI